MTRYEEAKGVRRMDLRYTLDLRLIIDLVHLAYSGVQGGYMDEEYQGMWNTV